MSCNMVNVAYSKCLAAIYAIYYSMPYSMRLKKSKTPPVAILKAHRYLYPPEFLRFKAPLERQPDWSILAESL